MPKPYTYSMPEAFMHDQSVPARWRLLAIVNGFAINGKSCFASNASLSKKLKCTEQTITNAVRELEKGGEIVVVRTSRSRSIHRASMTQTNLGGDPNQFGSMTQTNLDLIQKNNSESLIHTATSMSRKGQKAKRNPEEPLSLDQFVESCRQSDQPHIRVIAEYADEIRPNFNTRGQWETFIRRNVRAAKVISPFTPEQIGDAMSRLARDVKSANNPQGFITRWTLETLVKYLTS